MRKLLLTACFALCLYVEGDAQLPACSHAGTCAPSCAGSAVPPCTGECRIDIGFTNCRGRDLRKRFRCLPDSCKSQCECNCTHENNGTGYSGGISWYEPCVDQYRIQTFKCFNNCQSVAELPREECEDGGYYWNSTSNSCSLNFPTPQEECEATGWYWNFSSNTCQQTFPCFQGDVDACFMTYTMTWDWENCQCVCGPGCSGSPILIDVSGDGFDLTDSAGGVVFNLRGDGHPVRWSWTAAGSDEAWLALDRDGNGTIDSGAELFGNFTSQPEPPAGHERQGFLALAEYDKAVNGGNGDGVIDRGDAIFASLRLWQDINHNGFSEAAELRGLRDLGLKSIDLDYRESRREDEHGNRFKYRAKVKDLRGHQLGRWAWDVFLTSTGPPQ